MEGWIMRFYEIHEDKESLTPPTIDVGDEVKVGKFKNSKATVKGFKKDDYNQPVLKTNKGDKKLFNLRLSKLQEETDFETFQKQYAILNKAEDEANAKIQKIIAGKRGNMGLLDPVVKNSPEFKKAKIDYERASNTRKAFLKDVPKDFLRKNVQQRRAERTKKRQKDHKN